MSWFEETRESRRADSEEGLIIDATEIICEALNERGWTRAQLAAALDVRPSEITMRLRGSRNLTLRTVAAMLDALDYEVKITKHDRRVLYFDKTVGTAVETEPEVAVTYVTESRPRLVSMGVG